MNKRAVFIAIALLLAASVAPGGEVEPRQPGPKDKCPVCGMFVASHANWIAGIVFRDGATVFFDGPKDMFRYYFDFPRYEKGKTKEDVVEMFVTDYYTTKRIPARDARYVTGSDVHGPMGEELVAIRGMNEAETFRKDHNGKKVLSFDEVTPAEIPGGGGMHMHGN
jgi:copper chaperone NosL